MNCAIKLKGYEVAGSTLKNDIEILRQNLSIMENEAKIKQRKKFWGVIGTVVLTAVGLIIINNK